MNAESDGRRTAERFRAEHNLGVQPLGDLVALIEQTTGIDVAVLDAGPDEHGLTMRDRTHGTVFIGVARTRKPMRQRSTLAHELGHALFEDWADQDTGNWSDRSPAEIRADAFARHLLVPTEGLRAFLGDRKLGTRSTLSNVVQHFLVPPQIAGIALHQAGYLDDAAKQESRGLTAPGLAARFGWSDQYHVLQADSDQCRAPQQLLARAIRGYAEGVLPAQAVANLRGVPLEDAQRDLCEAGVSPAEHRVDWAEPADLPEIHVDLAALDEDLDAPTDGDFPTAEREP